MNLDQFRKLKDKRKLASVAIPQWDTSVSIRSWSTAERIELGKAFDNAKESNDTKAILATLCQCAALSLCDEEGNRFFPDNASELLDYDEAALKLINTAALELNGMSPEKVDEAKKN